GLPQPRLQTLFQKTKSEDDTTQNEPSDLQIDCCWLDITEPDRQILTGTNVTEPIKSKRPWDFWGLEETENNLPNPENPSVEAENIKGTWIEVLSNVNVMLNRSGLTYQELLQLVDLDYVNPASAIVIATVDPDESNCDTSNLRIENLSESRLNRVHRFIRLWRKLRCAMWQLDLLLPKTADENKEPI